MQIHKLLLLSCAALFAVAVPATAQNDLSAQAKLATAKFAGACGILDSMINVQKTTGIPGGDDFVTRFWAVEAARLGLSVKGLSDRCDQSIIAYEKLWKASEPARK
ncbi:MAG: hypothetical protein ING69_12880 [Rhodocyclaceae bacterium]|nr:hypothetical protein [Rhodocyclaceae bacterium]